MKQILQILAAAGFVWIAAGCGRPTGSPVTVASLASGGLEDQLGVARMDQPDTVMHSSYDRTGGNDDYGTFLCDSKTPGWKVLVDLKGPGFVSRVWFTGAKDGHPHRFRFYFDGEKKPRLEGDIKDLFGGGFAPFLAPLAEYNNYCWYSFVPMPYAKRLRIECEQGLAGAKLYYQISESPLPPRTPVETFAWPLPERDRAALEKARSVWTAKRFPESGKMQEAVLTDWSGCVSFAGPAIIRRLEFEPDWQAIPEELRDAALRDWMVSVHYDGSPDASVKVPLGDLCGVPWRRTRANSLFFGMTNDTLFCAFPMPFAASAEIRIQSERVAPVPVKIRAWVEERAESPIGAMGYFHAGWQRTTPDEVGRPHPILNAKGKGKYVGCLLSVCTLDNSYWVLEGDESLRKDGEVRPGWLGTGLEDYFNGGWYYQNVMAGPTHGLFFKEPFRTVQYRVHSMDPSQFSDSLNMVFERGTEHASRAFFESVSWVYFSEPLAADTVNLAAESRSEPFNPQLDPAVTMTALWNHERFDDWQGARDELASRLRKYGPLFPEPARKMLEFRLALLNEKLGGEECLSGFLASSDEPIRQAAEAIQKARSGAGALAVFYANMPAKFYVDGKQMLQAGRPDRPVWASLELPPGRHVLVIEAPRQQYPDWVQLAIRGKDWFAGTDATWKFSFNPQGKWQSLDYDDSGWPEHGGPAVKGPPEEPYVWVEPDPFLGMQSKALGLRPSKDWPARGGTVVYRKTITVP